MQRVHRFIVSLCLTTALTAPVALTAAPAVQDQDHDRDHQQRVYDRDHKDYHQWDDHEKEAWGRYLAENYKRDHDFQKASSKEQSRYWNWRHAHPD
jgi:hypothetical protein